MYFRPYVWSGVKTRGTCCSFTEYGNSSAGIRGTGVPFVRVMKYAIRDWPRIAGRPLCWVAILGKKFGVCWQWVDVVIVSCAVVVVSISEV